MNPEEYGGLLEVTRWGIMQVSAREKTGHVRLSHKPITFRFFSV